MGSNFSNQSKQKQQHQQQEELWTSVSISKKRKNALRIEAYKTRRTVGNFLEVFLEKHGIREISDSEYQSFIKGTEEEEQEMITAEAKI